MLEYLIPIVMFISVAAVIGLMLWFRYRSRREVQKTIRHVLDKGQELNPELIDRLGHPRSGPKQDLRLAVIWLALAAGLALCGWAVPDPTGYTLRACLAGAAFPFAIGAAYLIMFRFAGRD